eukprot:16452348-Heterocapsa_arctica.AAC.2
MRRGLLVHALVDQALAEVAVIDLVERDEVLQQLVEGALELEEVVLAARLALQRHDVGANVGRYHLVGRYPDHHVHRVVCEDLRCRVVGEDVPEADGEAGDLVELVEHGLSQVEVDDCVHEAAQRDDVEVVRGQDEDADLTHIELQHYALEDLPLTERAQQASPARDSSLPQEVARSAEAVVARRSRALHPPGPSRRGGRPVSTGLENRRPDARFVVRAGRAKARRTSVRAG